MAEIVYDGERVPIKDGEPLQPTLEEMGVPFACTEGICGTCVIEVIKGGENLTEKTEEEEDFLGDVASAFHHYVRHQSDGQTVGQVMSQVGTRGLSGRPAPLTEECNYTMENEYCPVHGLAECYGQGVYESELSRIKALLK